MNNVNLIGRLTRDPEIRETVNGDEVVNFTLAIDRPPKANGEKATDFPRVVCFRQAIVDTAKKWLGKGQMVGVTGCIQTGSYERGGQTIYSTDVIANHIDILEWPKRDDEPKQAEHQETMGFQFEDIHDESIPF